MDIVIFLQKSNYYFNSHTTLRLDPKQASICSKHVWDKENFKLNSIPLNEFIEYWCAGMHKDNIIVGTNFDHQLFGYEEEPLVLAKDLLELLKSNDIKINLVNYETIDEYIEIIDSYLESE